MGRILDYMIAARADGDQVTRIDSLTSVDKRDQINFITEFILYIYDKYKDVLSGKTPDEAEEIIKNVDRGVLCRQFGFGRAVDFSIMMAMLWTYQYVSSGVKGKIYQCYVDTGKKMSTEEILDIHKGRVFNSFILVNFVAMIDNLQAYDSFGDLINIEVMNVGIDEFDVMLGSNKER